MTTRNTVILKRIVEALGITESLARLESEFENELLIVAGTTADVAQHAEQLRLAITTPECALVLDHLVRVGEGGVKAA